MITAIVILSIIVVVLGFTTINLLRKNEKQEDILLGYLKYLDNISRVIEVSDEKVKKVEVLIAGCGIVGDYSMIVSKPDEGDNHAEIKTEVCNQVDINYPSFEVPPQES